MDEEESLKQVIRDTPYDLLQNNVYICFANGCLLLTAFLKLKGEPGWSAQLIDETGLPMLSVKEQQRVESAFNSVPWILDLFQETESPQTEQTGGAPTPSFSVAGSKLMGSSESSLTGDDVSLDAAFQKFLSWTTQMDERAQVLKYEGIGAPVQAFLDTDIIVPIGGPAGIAIPKKPLFLLLMALVDMFRLTEALSGNQNNLLTLFVMLEELVTGQWRQFILTSAGLLSPSGVAFGVIGKYIVNAWMLINPTLRDSLLKDVYKGTKSMIVGFLLWMASILPPNSVKALIEEKMQKAKGLVQGIGEKMKEVEEKTSRAIEGSGKRFKFTKLNADSIASLTLEDIQNLQALSQWNAIVCTKEYQDIIQPLGKEPIFRLLLELFGIPMTKEDRIEACGAGPMPTLDEKIDELLEMNPIDL